MDAATPSLAELVGRYKADPESVYNTWFAVDGDRVKAFRSIRRGVANVAAAIEDGSFGNDFKGSPLEVVLEAITEQKQVFKGAAHPFYWKPKLRIPDIYESAANQRTFGRFLAACLVATNETQVLAAMSRLADAKIKGVGPAAATIVYFLHPTLVLPFNTAIIKGYNALFADRQPASSWEAYFTIRQVILAANARERGRLSNDLGAFAGLLFEIGMGRLPIEPGTVAVDAEERARAERVARERHADVVAELAAESEHSEMQQLLAKVGRALGCDVHIARNDRQRLVRGEPLSAYSIATLPANTWSPGVADTISLIDVVWFAPDSGDAVAAFEVEKSTSIYSGILRLEDLARSSAIIASDALSTICPCSLYLVAPGAREHEVMAQFARPAFSGDLADLWFGYISFASLRESALTLAKVGDDHTIMRRIATCAPGCNPD